MEFSIKAAEEKGRELPEWYLDCPELCTGDETYFVAFWVLNSCRSVGMGIGPIPWTAIRQYVDHCGYDPDIKDLITKVVMAFDTKFIEKENEKMKKSMPKAPPSKPPMRR